MKYCWGPIGVCDDEQAGPYMVVALVVVHGCCIVGAAWVHGLWLSGGHVSFFMSYLGLKGVKMQQLS